MLVRWAIRSERDLLLDPACGDGQFITLHGTSVGVELDSSCVRASRARAPHALVYQADFFEWASTTSDRFDAAAGNPPFIRYQKFSGKTRLLSRELAKRIGVQLSGLASSWASFLVVTGSLLKPGGRMAFVVPAEIGHAPYSVPVIEFLCSHFDRLRIVAVRRNIFSHLSEGAWLLLADGYGGRTTSIDLSICDEISMCRLDAVPQKRVPVSSWEKAGFRLRKFLINDEGLSLYESIASMPGVNRLGDVATTGIGYVSGANDFFHLRPSDVKHYGIPSRFVVPAIRRSRQLPKDSVSQEAVDRWIVSDEPIMLLRLKRAHPLTSEVMSYLNLGAALNIQGRYKCRNRDPWYVIPDVRVPDAFLSYMSGQKPALVRNDAGCVCSNSVHAVFFKRRTLLREIQKAWTHPIVDLSCELEGHPLGGGMLKLEPREASNILIPIKGVDLTENDLQTLKASITEIRKWRNYD